MRSFSERSSDSITITQQWRQAETYILMASIQHFWLLGPGEESRLQKSSQAPLLPPPPPKKIPTFPVKISFLLQMVQQSCCPFLMFLTTGCCIKVLETLKHVTLLCLVSGLSFIYTWLSVTLHVSMCLPLVFRFPCPSHSYISLHSHMHLLAASCPGGTQPCCSM